MQQVPLIRAIEQKLDIKGVAFKIDDTSGRRGVIKSTKGLHFPIKEETEDRKAGKYLTVVYNMENGGLSDEADLHESDFEQTVLTIK